MLMVVGQILSVPIFHRCIYRVKFLAYFFHIFDFNAIVLVLYASDRMHYSHHLPMGDRYNNLLCTETPKRVLSTTGKRRLQKNTSV